MEILFELPEIEGVSFSKACHGLTTRKRILKKFRDAGLIVFKPGVPIELTEMGKEIKVQVLAHSSEDREDHVR